MNAAERAPLPADSRAARIAATVRPEVRRLARYEVPDAEGFVKLDAMENPYPLPPAIAGARAAPPPSARAPRAPRPSPA